MLTFYFFYFPEPDIGRILFPHPKLRLCLIKWNEIVNNYPSKSRKVNILLGAQRNWLFTFVEKHEYVRPLNI